MVTTAKKPRRTRRTPRHYVFLSLGAGIQSTALAVLLDRGVIEGCPRPEAAVFADTMAEPLHVYETLDWLEGIISYPVIRTSWGDLESGPESPSWDE